MCDWLLQRFSDYAERPFLAYRDVEYSYQDLADQIDHFARCFTQAGIRAGDVVILQGDYSLEGIASLFALFRIKAIAAPIATASSEEARSRQQEARARWNVTAGSPPAITSLDCESEPHEYVTRLREQRNPGLILFSSGSTGRPKAMIHDADRLLQQFAKKRARKLVVLIFLLFDHIGGLNTLFNGLSTGALIVVPPSRAPDVVAQTIQKHHVKLLPASPTFLNLLLMSGAVQKYDLSSLRFVTYGTEPMPESLLQRIKEALPEVALIQTFGTSETGISQTVSHSSSSTLIKFDDSNTEYKIVDGELWLRSKTQILGYLNHDMARFTPDGWFRTGDIVEEAENGFMKIVGRREDLINVGGEKVTPSEVESALLEMPEVIDCLVYGENNAITGQNVAAEVVPAEGQDPRTLKRLIKKHCREKLTPYKVPARIVLSDRTSFSARYKKMRTPQTNHGHSD